MQCTFQSTPAWQLDVQVNATPYGHHLVISSFVPTARRPEQHVQFSGTFSGDDLRVLRGTLDEALMGAHDNG